MSRLLRNKKLVGGTSNNARSILYTRTGQANTNVGAELDQINASLTELVAQHSDTTYSAVKGLGYDATGKKLGLVISQGGADTVIPFSGGGLVKSLTVAHYNRPAASTYAYIYCLNEDGTVYKDEGTTIDVNTIKTEINTNSDILNVSSLTTQGVATATVKKAGYYLYTDRNTNAGVSLSQFAVGATIFNEMQYGGFVAYLGTTNPFN